MHDDYDDYADQPIRRVTFPWMRPIAAVPTTFRVLGTGLTMVGRSSFHDDTASYSAAHCLTVLFVPVLVLGVYRVQDSPRGGWRFLGSEPLGVASWACNLFSVLLLLGLGGLGGWFYFVGAAEWRDASRLARAKELIGENRRGPAAALLGEILDGKSSRVAEARAALASLVENPGTTFDDVGAVFRAAAAQERKGPSVVPDLFKRGYEAADRIGTDAPADGLALLDLVAPFAHDATEGRQLERRLAEKLVEAKPGEMEPASRLGSLMGEMDKDKAKIKPLLAPFEDRLGALDGAAALAAACVEDGEDERAVKLLTPYLDARRAGYLAAAQRVKQTQQSVIARLSELALSGKAANFDLAKYNAAPKEKQTEMFRDFALPLMDEDADLRAATNALAREEAVFRGVITLSQARRHLAAKLSDRAARVDAFQEAERTLTSVGEPPFFSATLLFYKLRLAEVQAAAGKGEEARKTLDGLSTFEKAGPSLFRAAVGLLQTVGAQTDARAFAEAAYARHPDGAAKQDAARERAYASLDLDDRLMWLRRANAEDPDVKYSLALSQGSLAVRDSDDDAAVKFFRAGIDGITDKEEPIGLARAAFGWLSIADVTGDPEAFRQGVEKLDKASSLAPNNPALLGYVAGIRVRRAALEAIGTAIDGKVLRRRPNADLLGFLYADEAGRQKVLEKMRAGPHLKEARAELERAIVLGPRRPDLYPQLAAVLELLDDREALKALAARAEASDFDTGDVDRLTKQYHDRTKDATLRKEARSAVARAEKSLTEAREGKGATLAAAAAGLSGKLLALGAFEEVDADRAVKLAEEIGRAHV